MKFTASVLAFFVVLIVILLLLTTIDLWHVLFKVDDEAARLAQLVATAQYVGRATCAECHESATKLYAGSHHDRAMETADEKTVLGDFHDASFDHFGEHTTFSRRAAGFCVKTAGADGVATEYEIAKTFGVFPLQQYLINLKGGRVQAFSLAWDARPKEAGGQRWFHLYPNEAIPSSDILHWTGPAQNWNFMCAECHSTHLRKQWIAAERRYDTVYSEIDVSCEACHGPASEHVKWARTAAAADKKTSEDSNAAPHRTATELGLVADLHEPAAAWIIDAKSGLATRDRPRQSRAELETCAMCHARRAALFEDWLPGRPLLQTHKTSLLDEGLYQADGQQQDEVYEYGSFLQSRMHAKGVSCGDCHNPHSLAVSGGPDRVCAGCHAPQRFASTEHHHHEMGTPGASCVECHMPAQNYMVVHARRDHSFRVPRPDLTLKIGTPNACIACHKDRTSGWAQEQIKGWYPNGRWTKPHYGEAIAAGRLGLPGADRSLAALVDDLEQPGIVRATAMDLLANMLSPATVATLEHALADGDELVRMAAIGGLAALPPPQRIGLGVPLLSDPMRVVRIEAASALAGDAPQLPSRDRAAFAAALAEYRTAQSTNGDRPEGHANLGSLAARMGDAATARREYDEGIAIGPWFSGLWIDLADLLREQGDDAQGERVLRRGLTLAAAKGVLHHALGLNLARQKRNDDALVELRDATQLEPDNTRFAYVYGISLLSASREQEALAVLDEALVKRPGDRDVLVALATANRDRGDYARARLYAQRLVAMSPGDGAARKLLEQLDAVLGN